MQVEHYAEDFPVELQKEFLQQFENQPTKQQFSAFGQIEEYNEEKMEAEMLNPEVKEVHVFKRGGLAEINARLRHEEPELTRKKRRKKAKRLFKGKNA